MESEPGRRTGAASKADEGLAAQGINTSVFRSGRCAAGAAAGFEPPYAIVRSREIDTSAFRWPLPNR